MDIELRNKIALDNINLVRKIAIDFIDSAPGYTFDDAFQEGFIGLLKAIEQYPGEGPRGKWYAKFIRNQIKWNIINSEIYFKGEVSTISLYSMIEARSRYKETDPINWEKVRDEINEVLSDLSDREKNVMKMYYGLSGGEFNLQEIGDIMCLTRSRVHQIKTRAIRRLRYKKRHQALKEIKEKYICV